MPRPSPPDNLARVVFFKEMRETFRDKRVILGVIVFPLFITPLILAVAGFFAGKKEIAQQTANIEVGYLAESPFPELEARLRSAENMTLIPVAARQEAVRSRSQRVVLIVPSESRQAYHAGQTAPLEIIYDQANENSSNAKFRLEGVIQQFDRETVEQRLEAASLDRSFINPIEVTETSLASSESMGGFLLSLFLPYLVVMTAAFGGINSAFDICAGEKERGTMETLLVSPASRYDIVQGKLYTIFVVSLLSAICAIVGMLVAVQGGFAIMSAVVGNSLSISYLTVAALLLIVAPLALLTSSGLLFVSSFARNQKEAQAYIFPFMMVVILPAILSSILGAEAPLYTAFIPILTERLTHKNPNDPDGWHLASAVLNTLLLDGLAGQPEVYDRILVRRNRRWTRAIIDMTDDSRDYLVIVGTLHLIGQDSVQRMLGESGIRTRQLH